MTEEEKEFFEMMDNALLDDSRKEEPIIELHKYMVIENKGMYEESVFGVYDIELDALRRCKAERKKRKTNITVIKADIEYVYLSGVRFIKQYEELI